MLRERMARYPENSAYVWVDDDIVFTNFKHDMIQRALDDHPNAAVLVTADSQPEVSRLNTGIIILRNSAKAKAILDEMWQQAMVSSRSSEGASLAHASQSECLHEQDALSIMVVQQAVRQSRGASCDGCDGIVVLPQRLNEFNMNTFLRWNHFNKERQTQLRYDGDRPWSKWRVGDFAGHCTGLSHLRRGVCIRALLASVIRTDDDADAGKDESEGSDAHSGAQHAEPSGLPLPPLLLDRIYVPWKYWWSSWLTDKRGGGGSYYM